MDSLNKKLYVGNLNFRTTEQMLESLFTTNNFGVEEVLIIKDKLTGRSKGFGFVRLQDETQVDDAIAVLNGTSLEGRLLKINVARPMEKRPQMSHSYGRGYDE